jgi:hypothetical protein
VASQDVNFDFTSRGADKLASDFRKTGDNAAIAAKGARLCADALDKQRKAASTSAGATIALAKADKILEEAEHGLAEGALEAEFALKKQGDAAKKAGLDAAAASTGVSSLAGTGGIPGGGMGAAVAAGVALAPVLVTLGVGFAGLGAAAVGIAKPIADAAQKTGGLAANLKSLDPAQQAVAKSILGLGKEYDQFQKALQPQILTIFNQGIKIAGGLLKDVQPVAAATGKAFSGFLGQLDKEFSSGKFQDFFKFMADTAAPDMQLLGNLFIALAADLPPLLEALQPIAEQMLSLTTNLARATGALADFGKSNNAVSKSVGTNTGLLGFLSKAVANVTSFMKPGGVYAGAFKSVMDGIPGSAGAAGAALDKAAHSTLSQAAASKAAAAALAKLTGQYNAALSPLLAYTNAIITQRTDADALNKALKTSHDRIGLNTTAQRASFSAAQTYIQDLLNTAGAAVKSHQGIDAQIRSIQGALPLLQNVKGGTRAYRQEVSTLVGWLHKLQAIKLIQEAIHISGTGVWTVTPGKIGLPGGSAGGPFAYGGQVTGGTPGRDSVFGMLMPGEVVVPTNMVRAGAVDHLRGSLPGFATGGVVGSYGPGAVSGLPRWTAMETNATVSAVARSTAESMIAGIKAAQAAAANAAAAGGPGVAGPGGGAPAANAALARRLMPAWGSGAEWNAWNYLEMREAGWNQFARNPSSGAYGIPQALPPGKMGAAANPPQSNPTAQIRWMIGYIRGRYGDPIGAAAHERAFNWYGKGGLVPGYASGGTVARQGAAWLHAWRSRHGGGFGAAHGPVNVNEQIARMSAAAGRAQSLAGASGLSPGQHRFWASAAADEKKRLGVLHRELATERSWRTMLELDELALAREVASARGLPGLAGPVRGWKARIGRDKAAVAGISKMLGYSGAYLAAHKPHSPGPKVTPPGVPGSIPHTGVYTDSTADLISQLFASLTSNSRVVTLDSGGWLMPGVQAVANRTGRPEQVIPPGRGGYGGGGTVVLQNHGVIGSQAQLEDWLVRSLDNLKRKRRI